MPVKIPQLNSCCCGCTLKTGTKIIGWLNLIGGILILLTMWMSLAVLFQIHPDSLPDSPEKEDLLKLLPVTKILLIIVIVMSLIGCVLSVVLLLGVYQNKPGMVMIWIVATLIITIISAFLNIAQVIAVQNWNFLSNVISCLLNIYFLLVVYSYYRENKNSPNNYE